MENEVYVKLGERMNQFEGRYPLVNAYINVLKEMCTEEEAQLASVFPEGSHRLSELAEFYRKDEAGLVKILDAMIWKGLIFTSTTEEGEKEYSLIPILPGAMEYYILRRLDKPDEIKKYLDLYTLMHVEAKQYIDKLMAEVN